MNKVSKEKTLKALKETIERWEKIRDLGMDFKTSTQCVLCDLFGDLDGECRDCPIRKKTGQEQCRGTPYRIYQYNPTKENAQKEVDFLKDLYIEMLEDYAPPLEKSQLIYEEKAEPKEEWEDITPDCVVKIDQPLNGYYHLTFWHKEKHIAYTDMYKDGCPEATEIIQDSRIDNYKIEKQYGDFRIMRRVEK